jgi:hypothetical protein
LLNSSLVITWLAEYPVFYNRKLVGTDDEGVAMFAGDGFGLFSRQQRRQ